MKNKNKMKENTLDNNPGQLKKRKRKKESVKKKN